MTGDHRRRYWIRACMLQRVGGDRPECQSLVSLWSEASREHMASFFECCEKAHANFCHDVVDFAVCCSPNCAAGRCENLENTAWPSLALSAPPDAKYGVLASTVCLCLARPLRPITKSRMAKGPPLSWLHSRRASEAQCQSPHRSTRVLFPAHPPSQYRRFVAVWTVLPCLRPHRQ